MQHLPNSTNSDGPCEFAGAVAVIQADQCRRSVDEALRKLIERLTHVVADRHLRIGQISRDDLRAIAATAIWKAARSYSPLRVGKTGRRASFSTHACRVMNGQVADHWRKERRHHVAAQPLEDRGGIDATVAAPIVGEADRLHLAERLEAIRPLLTDREWAVFDLRRRGYTYPEIAAEIRTTKKTVETRLKRIRRKIASSIGGERDANAE